MKIDILTLTGADDTVEHQGLYDLTNRFPFVEWGILLSKSNQGVNRFPTKKWIYDLKVDKFDLKLSGHLCGKWVSDICHGNWSFLDDCPEFLGYFTRFQLNFHGYSHVIKNIDKFIDGFKDPRLASCKQFIFQLDDVNNEILDIAVKNEINAVGLFDTSGGAGILPESWQHSCYEYCGYAGGLGPHNLKEQMEKLDKVVGDKTIWIDMETHIRDYVTDDFDYEKCRQCLEIGKNWIN